MSEEVSREEMLAVLERQRAACIADGAVSLEVRQDRLNRAIDVVVANAERFVEALREDFGHRSVHQSTFTDVVSSITPLKDARSKVKKWMRPEKRKTAMPFSLLGSSSRVEYQPLGVVGVISPWNFPVQLTFAPLSGIFAAGNRVMIKPSEFTPLTSQAMKDAFASAFDETEVAVFVGGPETGGNFSSLPFDHLLFTGATSIAKHVMRAAAENLVPVTLELGGKSPVIVSDTADLQQTADRVMFGKTLNAGQICLAPDYVMLPEGKAQEFVESSTRAVENMYPTLLDNPDYTSVINQRHFDRINGYVEDAREKGAKVVEINPADEDFRQQPHHKIPPTLILDPSDEMAVMQEEIFGPVLPVKTYAKVDEAIDYVNANDRPLGLYYFGKNGGEEREVLNRTTSGGVTVNDVIMHISQEDLPFGGVGPSGMGSYHGFDGFKTFSHAKAVYRQTGVEAIAKMMRPPWGEGFTKMMQGQVKN